MRARVCVCIWSNEHRFLHSDFFQPRAHTGSFPRCWPISCHSNVRFCCSGWRIPHSLYRHPFICALYARLKSGSHQCRSEPDSCAPRRRNAFSVIAISYHPDVVYHFFWPRARVHHHLSFVIVVAAVVFIAFVFEAAPLPRHGHRHQPIRRAALVPLCHCYHLMTPNNKRATFGGWECFCHGLRARTSAGTLPRLNKNM